ncbi:MAG: OsmC family peroxiredoxin [Chloroflexota bacterium]|jgi:osmotically inducible protein OsmC
MPTRYAEATWEGNLVKGNGKMKLGSGLCEVPHTHASRFKEGQGSNPEELVGAALAGCYSMYLSSILAADDFTPNQVNVSAAVTIDSVDGAPTIHTIELDCTADIPGIGQDEFMKYAMRAKVECPVSKALSAVDSVTLSANLES